MSAESIGTGGVATPGGAARAEAGAQFADALTASRLRIRDTLVGLVTARPEIANLQDSEGRCCLHYAAEHNEGLEEVLAVEGIKSDVKDKAGDIPLHFAAAAPCPMAAYALVKVCPEACLTKNNKGSTAADLAKEKGHGEVLNAMLLACCSTEANPKDQNSAALTAIEMLLDAGAVPDTWAPNGNSALMMAASADSPAAIALLLKKKAQINMKDTLGRTALMFAAGNDARKALSVLMDAGGQEALSLQDNRGNNVTKYACGEETKQLVERRFAELEEAAAAHQTALLADLAAEEKSAATAKHRRGHRGKKKKKAAVPKPQTAEQEPSDLDGLAASSDASDGQKGREAPLDSSEIAGHEAERRDFAAETPVAQVDATISPEKGERTSAAPHATLRCTSAAIVPADSATSLDNLVEGTPPATEKATEARKGGSPLHPGSKPGSALEAERDFSVALLRDVIDKQTPSQEHRRELTRNEMILFAALDLRDSCYKQPEATEPVWQEVKKSSKTTSCKPPGSKRSSEKFSEQPQSLFPSSSSVSLDSLGDSSASGASALSFPSGALHVAHQALGHSGNGLPLSGRRNPKPTDPMTAQPSRSNGGVPKAVSKPGSAAQSMMSWANVVQGRVSEPLEGMTSSQTLNKIAERETDKQASGSPLLSPEAEDHHFSGSLPSSALEQPAPEARKDFTAGSQETLEGEPGPEARAPPEEDLKAEIKSLRQQLLQADVNRQRLEERLISVHQDHRLLLQKAVEDTARNVLHQEQQKYQHVIEVLQLLLLKANQQLHTSQQVTQQGPAWPTGAPKPGRSFGAGSPKLQQLVNMSSFQSGSPRVASPVFGFSPQAAPRTGSPRPAPVHSSGHQRGFQSSEGGASKPAVNSRLEGKEAKGPRSSTLSASAAEWPPLSARATSDSSVSGQPGATSANPWARGAADQPERSKTTLRPLLPSLDSIWGPGSDPAAKPSFTTSFQGVQVESKF